MKYFVADLSQGVKHNSTSSSRVLKQEHITRVLPDHEIILVLEGVLHMRQGNEEFVLKKGDIFISEIGIEYGGYDLSTCFFKWTHFNLGKERTEENLEAFSSSEKEIYLPQFMHTDDYTNLIIMFSQLIHYSFCEYDEIVQAMRDNIMAAMLGEIAFLNEREKSINTEKNFSSIIEYLKCEPYLTSVKNVREFAQKFGYNEKYFIRLFKKETGFTPLQYFINKKITIAKSLLCDEDNSLKLIAELLGYKYAYFCKIFKLKTGITPTEYRMATISSWRNVERIRKKL